MITRNELESKIYDHANKYNDGDHSLQDFVENILTEFDDFYNNNAMKVKVIEHTENHDLNCVIIDSGKKITVDPFVTSAIVTELENYKKIASDLIGKQFEMSDYWIKDNCYLCNKFTEIK